MDSNLQAVSPKNADLIFDGQPYTLGEGFLLAVKYQKLAKYKEAKTIYRLILDLVPDHVPSLNNLGFLLFQFEDTEESIQLCSRAIELNPNYYFAYNNLGSALMSKGDAKAAEEVFRKVISLQPNFPRAIYNLCNIGKYQTPDHPDVLLIKDLLKRPDATADDREHLNFALGKIYDDCGLYDEAFAYYREGNNICTQSVIYNADAILKENDHIMQVFSKDFMTQDFSFASDSETPIFVVGMPRSGTTLMANILSNHPVIAAAGELPTIIECSTRFPQLLGAAYPEGAKHMTQAAAMTLIEEYNARLRRGIDGDARHIIDKHPINFRYLGLISMLFPKARVIHCTRNPIDTCLSNYFQHFDFSYSYSFDLHNIAHFYRDYKRLMTHWKKSLPLPMLEISYEDMIENTEAMARKTLGFIGVDWDERCLAPQTNPRPVKTASMWQVRQPIYKKSKERWRHYEMHLGELKEALEVQ